MIWKLRTSPPTRTFSYLASTRICDISSLIEREYERELFRWAADRVQQTVAPQTWQAFWLTEVNGQTVQQAAETIGTTAGHIYVNRSRVMARIKEFVKEHEAKK